MTHLTVNGTEVSVADILKALAQAGLTQEVSTEVPCGQPLLTKEGICSAPAVTEEGTCKRHTSAKKAAHEAAVISQEAARTQREAFLSGRAEEVRGRIASEGGLVILTKYNGTVTSRSRRDLAALGVRGLTKASTVAQAVAAAEAAGLKVTTQAALAVAEA